MSGRTQLKKEKYFNNIFRNNLKTELIILIENRNWIFLNSRAIIEFCKKGRMKSMKINYILGKNISTYLSATINPLIIFESL